MPPPASLVEQLARIDAEHEVADERDRDEADAAPCHVDGTDAAPVFDVSVLIAALPAHVVTSVQGSGSLNAFAAHREPAISHWRSHNFRRSPVVS